MSMARMKVDMVKPSGGFTVLTSVIDRGTLDQGANAKEAKF